MRKRNCTITIRCTEDERQRIYDKARRYNLSISDYILRSALGKKIIVVEGLSDVLKAQKAIGNNLNQIALLANMGRLKAVNLERIVEQHKSITQRLCEIAKAVK
ncbi:plasmid mobilization protein [uncultured Ruminococcus sp.]|uniref:plasmid mobilization protein n=1 Tax=uncultured Ruminococcus sp. TaxID=165186 RepID=UPI0025D45F75|nr:plasmid mobilization relaxosome protein MobC [uncultured Ruminococcus sp.]